MSLDRAEMLRLLKTFAKTLLVLAGLSVALVLPWRWVSPPTTAFMIRERSVNDEAIRYAWTPADRISPNLMIAAIAAEDQKFYDHFGFDLAAIREALERNAREGSVRGGSTISQQVAKNLFLWPDQSWLRKGVEAYLTLWIELLWPKERILEVYLNVAEFGRGTFGVGAAAEHLLGKAPEALDEHDAALLVAVLPSPRRMDVRNPSDYVRTRTGEIQASVRQLGGVAYLRER